MSELPKYKGNIISYLPEFAKALEEQLTKDNERWGDTWQTRGLVWDGKTQEERAYNRFLDYLDMYRNAGKPIPWLKIAGECVICWIREKEYRDQGLIE